MRVFNLKFLAQTISEIAGVPIMEGPVPRLVFSSYYRPRIGQHLATVHTRYNQRPTNDVTPQSISICDSVLRKVSHIKMLAPVDFVVWQFTEFLVSAVIWHFFTYCTCCDFSCAFRYQSIQARQCWSLGLQWRLFASRRVPQLWHGCCW